MNELHEQVVPKAKDAKYGLKIALIIVAAIGIPTFIACLSFITNLMYFFVVAFFVFLFCIYGVWFFITSLKVDYEYAFLSSVLRVDKVIAKRRRKKILKIDVKNFNDIFPFDDKEMGSRKFKKIYRACANEFSEDNYVACFHIESRGNCALIFTPNEEFLNAMKPYFSADLKKKLFLNNKNK